MSRRRGAVVRFTGGSSYTDLPVVTIERLVDGAWVAYEDQTGAVQTGVDFPTPGSPAGSARPPTPRR